MLILRHAMPRAMILRCYVSCFVAIDAVCFTPLRFAYAYCYARLMLSR